MPFMKTEFSFIFKNFNFYLIFLTVEFPSRDVTYLVGTEDTLNCKLTNYPGCVDNDLATYCPAMLQGNNRLDRILKWKMYLNFFYNDDNIHNVVFAEGVVHDPVQMLKSIQGKCVIFNVCQNTKKFPSHPHDGSAPSEVKPEGSISNIKYINKNNDENKIVNSIFQKTIYDSKSEIHNNQKDIIEMKNLRLNGLNDFQNEKKKLKFDKNNNENPNKKLESYENEKKVQSESEIEIEIENELDEKYSQIKENYNSRETYLKYMPLYS